MKTNYKLIMKSIKKWQAVLDGKEEGGISDCPLCRVYHDVYTMFNDDNDDDDCCIKCPIYKKTNRICCKGTPYETWITHQDKMHSLFYHGRKVRCKVCEIIARDMIKFLKKLAVEWKNKK